MRILFAIAHYCQFLDKTALYASLKTQSEIRLNNLSNCIASLYQTFSPFQSVISSINSSAFLANQIEANEIDIIICTTQGNHLLESLTISNYYYQHYPTQVEPFLLGFECQKILSENIEKYDYFCFLEDDIIIQDPLFFTKLNWFNFGAGNSCLLQPNRYEITEVQKPFKVYIDGSISPLATQKFQNIKEEYEIEGDLLTIPVIFRRPLNPHSGCYFLNQEQMKYWSEQSYFLDIVKIQVLLAR